MLVRGARRRRGVDRGFVMSDHADWPGLQRAIAATGAERVFVTHGSTDVMVRWLRESRGLDAQVFATEYGGDADNDDDAGAAPRPGTGAADTINGNDATSAPGAAQAPAPEPAA